MDIYSARKAQQKIAKQLLSRSISNSSHVGVLNNRLCYLVSTNFASDQQLESFYQKNVIINFTPEFSRNVIEDLKIGVHHGLLYSYGLLYYIITIDID